MTASGPNRRKAVVVGAGPVGCLAAMSLAKMGWSVDIYEGRPDMRLPSSKAAAQQRSINLAISARGLAAIQAIDPGAADRFLSTVIPMHGRMIHDAQGRLQSQPYDRDGQCINSIGRAFLNEDLLKEALAVPGIRAFFQHKVASIDFDRRIMKLQDVEAARDVDVSFDFCVGADGSYSIVRRQLMRVVRMDYQQWYIPHDYLELKMPAGPPQEPGGDPSFLLDPNHLHIWPRHTFMLIALPNKDGTFTCTLFAPTADFDRLDSDEAIVRWFSEHFPDALPLIGEQALLEDFHRNPRSALMSIKARPYHYKDRAVLLGDAAHAMVPFYGQGLNCGLEDVRVLDVLLREAQVDATSQVPEGEEDGRLASALARYSETRHEDLVAICDLAMDNYVEMRHAVTTVAYRFRKALDNVLYSFNRKSVAAQDVFPALAKTTFVNAPSGWLPLYTMVSFRPDISYSTLRRRFQRQTEILELAGWLSVGAAVGTVGITCVTLLRRLYSRP
ncbi:FAD/NAD-P-binding domain-containing protein [Trametes versicolor FP-101664 SS1]|uniref:FAD/NAD-P-binding domain-containing protein n=1 Tax=Trametes versicolor (strain FP-101664) TaxID=717944 RepID=UPI00046222BC|nr:FAD/NAD-P-binding domain-containing protein [Trametes versicolor FP-101664 SS1]EIW60002.1 FAD/NAD-P-binding domain-containing protein [Trametes versicolor FP-101664 SS1]